MHNIHTIYTHTYKIHTNILKIHTKIHANTCTYMHFDLGVGQSISYVCACISWAMHMCMYDIVCVCICVYLFVCVLNILLVHMHSKCACALHWGVQSAPFAPPMGMSYVFRFRQSCLKHPLSWSLYPVHSRGFSIGCSRAWKLPPGTKTASIAECMYVYISICMCMSCMYRYVFGRMCMYPLYEQNVVYILFILCIYVWPHWLSGTYSHICTCWRGFETWKRQRHFVEI